MSETSTLSRAVAWRVGRSNQTLSTNRTETTRPALAGLIVVDVAFPTPSGRPDFVKKRNQACTYRRSILDTDGAILVLDESVRDRDTTNVFDE